MKEKWPLFLAVLILLSACQSYDIFTLIYQDDIKKQIAAGSLRIRVEEEQIPYVSDLLLDRDPLIRLAALKIMETNPYEDFLNPLLETTLDEDDRVSGEAYRILEAYPDWTLTFLEENLDTMGDLLCLNALDILTILGEPTSREAIIGLFNSSSDRKKNGAARTLAGMVELESPLMLELKSSPDASRRSGYYRIVGHYGDSTLIPLLFEGIKDESPDVWGACISAIYQFGEDSFPYVDRYIHTGDYLMSISCLQILEAVKSEKSLPLLLSFYTDTNRLLAQKAAIIVKSYGEIAIPYLRKGITEEEDYQNRLILWTLREIHSPEALPLYLELLDLQDPVLHGDILLSLSSLGESIWKDLRHHVNDAVPAVGLSLVSLLVDEGDLELLEDTRCAYYFISRIPRDDFEDFFLIHDVENEVEEDFTNLRKALELNGTLKEILFSSNRYFKAYRELLTLQSERDLSLEYALKFRRESIKAGNDDSLMARSEHFMSNYEKFDREVDDKEVELDRLPLGEQKVGEELIFRYLDTRREIVEIWIGISPRFRVLAQLVYNDFAEDIDDMLKEVSKE
jgi:HEAT repeat protein